MILWYRSAAILKAPNFSLTFESFEVVVSSAGDLAVATGLGNRFNTDRSPT